MKLHEQIKQIKEEFKAEALYGNYTDYNNAKKLYFLMRWGNYIPKRDERNNGNHIPSKTLRSVC